MHEKDLEAHYMITKQGDTPVDIKKLITSIKHYVQNNKIYFSYYPSFIKGVLIFGIVGFLKDHINLKLELGTTIMSTGCTLSESKGKNNYAKNN